MENRCATEIIDLHKFFEDWFGGKVSNTDVVFARFVDCMDNGFVLISPDGSIQTLAELKPMLRAAHGSRPGVRIWATNARLLHRMDGHVVMAYEEWQVTDGAQTRRQSSAVFRTDAGLPQGVQWVHLHETWLK